MQRGATGRFEVTAAGGERVEAFVPEPLPPEPPLDLAPLQPALERALLAVGRLDALSTLLPDTHLFLYAYVRKEAVLSSQIEGTQSSLSELMRSFVVDCLPKTGWKALPRYRSAAASARAAAVACSHFS